MKMQISKFLTWKGFPAVLSLTGLLVAGCVQSHRYPPIVYTTTPAVVPVPTSDRSVVRVYPGDTVAEVTTPSTAAPASDWRIADEIRRMLEKQAFPSRDLHAVVDQGVVTLYGEMGTAAYRREMEDRIARIPGVVDVDSRLQVAPF